MITKSMLVSKRGRHVGKGKGRGRERDKRKGIGMEGKDERR